MNKNNHFYLLGAVIATGILSFSGVLIETAMNVTFPTLINEFGLSTSKIQWVTTIYLLVIAITIPLSSYFNERFSAIKLFLVSWGFDQLFLTKFCHAIIWPTFTRGGNRDWFTSDVTPDFD